MMNLENILEVAFFLCMIANAALFIPQAMKLYKVKNSKEISTVTFLGFILIQLFTVLHAYFVKDWLLFFGTALSMITCGSVVYLSILYRVKH